MIDDAHLLRQINQIHFPKVGRSNYYNPRCGNRNFLHQNLVTTRFNYLTHFPDVLCLLYLNLFRVKSRRRSARRNSGHQEIARRFFSERGSSENYRTISISTRHVAPAMQTRPRLRSRRKHKSPAWKVVNSPFRFKVPPRSISVLSIGTLVSHTIGSRQPAICRPINGFVVRARSLSPIINIPRREGARRPGGPGARGRGWKRDECEISKRAQLTLV